MEIIFQSNYLLASTIIAIILIVAFTISIFSNPEFRRKILDLFFVYEEEEEEEENILIRMKPVAVKKIATSTRLCKNCGTPFIQKEICTTCGHKH